MKIKDIIVREAGETGQIASIDPVNKTATIKSNTGEFEVPLDKLTINPQNQYEVPSPPSSTPPKPGTSVNLIPPQPGQSTPLTNPTNTTNTTNTTNPTNNEIKVAEVSDEDLNNLEELSDDELIALARDNGIEAKLDDQGELINRDELIDLLQSGADIGGDEADDFIDDVEDQEYGQMMERIKQLSGLRCV